MKRQIFTVACAIVGLVLGCVAWGTFYTIDEGHVGIVKRFGKAVNQQGPGLHFKTPIIDSVVEIEIRTKRNLERMSVATKEQMAAQAVVSINWTVNQSSALDLFREYGSLDQFEERVLDPRLRSSAKESISKFTAEENINIREQVGAKILESLEKSIEGFPIKINSAQYEDISLPKQYLESINAKQTAKNERDAENFKLEKQALVAQQAVNTANAKRDSTKAIAEGDAFRISEIAKANAESIILQGNAEAAAIDAKVKALSNNKLYVDLMEVEGWNGSKVTTILGPSSIPQIKLDQ